MTRKLFGTDGVRGTANTFPMTAELALKLGAAVGRVGAGVGAVDPAGVRVTAADRVRAEGGGGEGALFAAYVSDRSVALFFDDALSCIAEDPVQIGLDTTLGFAIGVHEQRTGDGVTAVGSGLY